MGALNLVRFLLSRAAAAPSPTDVGSAGAPPSAPPALPTGAVARLRLERLEPLDGWLRRRMDHLHADIRAAEAREPPPPTLTEMRTSFTHLHVAADVVARTIELCAAHGGAAGT